MSNNKYDAPKMDERLDMRKKRVRLMKRIMVTTLVVAVFIPVLLCVFLMIRMNRIERQLDTLTEAKSLELEDYLDNSENTQSGSIVHAAEKEDVLPEETPSVDIPASGESVLIPEEQLDLETTENKVYLTFDDGPGKYTDELLDVLKEYNVKATFFVIGKTDKDSLARYKRIVDEGHTLGMHSYSHQYSKIYKSVKAFKADMEKLSDLLYNTTGQRPTIYRFPGGSSNTVSALPMTKFISYLNKKGITYYDWNAINGDATGKVLTENQMIRNVLDSVEKNKNSIVLMHDTVSRDTTLKSIPRLITRLQKEGYVLLPITKYTNTVQHIKADTVE